MTGRDINRRAMAGHAGLPLVLLLALGGCGSGEDGGGVPPPILTPPSGPSPAPVKVDTDFRNGADGWIAAFSDYPASANNPTFELGAGLERVPSGPTDRTGFYLSGNNRSDDLFMYLYRPVSGLSPNTRYRVEASVTFATNVPAGCAGIGGSPGESVYVKAGAAGRAPAIDLSSQGGIYPNFSKGNQATGGTEVATLGDFADRQATTACGSSPYALKTLTTAQASPGVPTVTTDAQGRAWLVVGTDSGFEGTTRIYWTSISFTLSPG